MQGLRALAEQNHVAFGTVDSWLIWNLTQGSEHVIEASNASRTMLMDLKTQQWDAELIEPIFEGLQMKKKSKEKDNNNGN